MGISECKFTHREPQSKKAETTCTCSPPSPSLLTSWPTQGSGRGCVQSLSEDSHSTPSLHSCLRAGPDERRLFHEACEREALTPPQPLANWNSGRKEQREGGGSKERGKEKDGGGERGIKGLKQHTLSGNYSLCHVPFIIFENRPMHPL